MCKNKRKRRGAGERRTTSSCRGDFVLDLEGTYTGYCSAAFHTLLKALIFSEMMTVIKVY